jgi:hypothetical protein
MRSTAESARSTADAARPVDDSARVAPRRAFGRAAAWAAVGLCAVLAVVHARVVWPHYHVGSFDDDASYVQVARALAHGHGLTSTLTAGVPMVASYPPGYAAVLAPIALVSGSAYAAFRGLSVGLVAVLVLLVWWYLRRRGMPTPLVLAVLVLLALNPVLGTFSMMVMAELPFMVLLMGVLFALDRWESSPRLWTWAGVATVVGCAGMVWLKEAGAGLVIGFVLWLLLRRETRRAVVLAVGSFALFLPVLVAREVAGVNLLGSRYANEFGTAFHGGAVHVVLHAISTYINFAIPQAVVPTSVSPLPMFGWASVTLDVFGTLTAPLVLIGFMVWCARHRDAMCVAVPVYLLTTLVFPYTNERRLILVLPFVLAWYVLGWVWVVTWVRSRWRSRSPSQWRVARPVVFALPLVALLILVPQFGRDYLFDLGHGSSQPRSAPYTRLVAQLGTPQDLVETDYVWTTSLFTGHRTAPGAFYLARSCAPDDLARGLAKDQPSFLLSGAFASIPGPGSPCLLAYMATNPSAVRIFRTAFDDASVFELLGPGTPHPDLSDLTGPVTPTGQNVGIFQALPQGPGDPGGPYPIVTPVGGTADVTWDFGSLRQVSQVSLGQAFSPEGGVQSVTVSLRGPDGAWHPVASAAGAVGDHGVVPYILQSVAMRASALRVEVRTAADKPVYLLDAHALGS